MSSCKSLSSSSNFLFSSPELCSTWVVSSSWWKNPETRVERRRRRKKRGRRKRRMKMKDTTHLLHLRDSCAFKRNRPAEASGGFLRSLSLKYKETKGWTAALRVSDWSSDMNEWRFKCFCYFANNTIYNSVINALLFIMTDTHVTKCYVTSQNANLLHKICYVFTEICIRFLIGFQRRSFFQCHMLDLDAACQITKVRWKLWKIELL